MLRDVRIAPWWVSELGWVPAGFAKAAKRLVPKCLSECMSRDIEADDIRLDLKQPFLGQMLKTIMSPKIQKPTIVKCHTNNKNCIICKY